MIERLIVRFLEWFVQYLPMRLMPRGELPYAERFFICGRDGEQKAWGFLAKLRPVFIHHFLGVDDDRYHNHPYEWAVSFILAFGYVELRIERSPGGLGSRATSKVYRFGKVNVIRANTYHKIIAADAWTLFIAGPKTQSWGFLDSKGRYVNASGGVST